MRRVKRNSSPGNRVSIALVALIGALGAGIWYLTGLAVDTSPTSAPRPNAATERPANDDQASLAPAQRTVAELPESARRPLFFADRRPPSDRPKAGPAETQGAKPAPPLYPSSQFQLIGVLSGRSVAAQALIRTTTDGQGTWVRVGENIRGWKIREISADNAVLETGGQRAELRLDPGGAPPPR